MSFERPRSNADWISAGAVLLLLCVLVYPLLHMDETKRQLFVHSDSWLTMLFLVPTTLIWIISYAICILVAVSYFYRAGTGEGPWNLVDIHNSGGDRELMPICLLICGMLSVLLFKQIVYPSLVGGRSMYELWLMFEFVPLYGLLQWLSSDSSPGYGGGGGVSSSEDSELRIKEEDEIDRYANEFDMGTGYGNRDEPQMRWQRDSPNSGLRKDYKDLYDKRGNRRK